MRANLCDLIAPLKSSASDEPPFAFLFSFARELVESPATVAVGLHFLSELPSISMTGQTFILLLSRLFRLPIGRPVSPRFVC
jgi:hypothetical protein